MNLKFTEKLRVIAMKNDPKFERGIYLLFQKLHQKFNKS